MNLDVAFHAEEPRNKLAIQGITRIATAEDKSSFGI
jgi:hypothetical protein